MTTETEPAREPFVVLGLIQQQAWRDRVLPPVEQVAADLWSVPVPIPDNPLRYTLSYVLTSGSRLVVVDPGWDSEAGWTALVAGLAAAGATTADVTGIVATHVHSDHHGLSARLQAASGAWIGMHPAEAATLPQRVAAGTDGAATDQRGSVAEWLRRVGDPPAEAVAQMMSVFAPSAATDPGTADSVTATQWRPMAAPDVLLDDGDLVPLPGRHLRAIWTPGHTPGHLCLADEDARLLLTGDHLLPRISPNIGARPQSPRPMLQLYLESLRAINRFDDHDALPAHEYRFRGIAGRADELVDHHEERCREILLALHRLGAPTLWALAEQLTWSRSWAEIGAMRIAALGETAAHVELLVERGDVTWDADDSPARVRLRRAA